MGQANSFLKLIMTLAMAAIVIGISLTMLAFFTSKDRGIEAITKEQELQQFQALEDLNGVKMSGASVTSFIMENKGLGMGFLVDNNSYGYNLTQSGEFFTLDLEDYYEFDTQLIPQDIYLLETLYTLNEVPIGVKFTKQ